MFAPLRYCTFFFAVIGISYAHAQTFSIPYYEDFETGSPGWVSDSLLSGADSKWELGTPFFGSTNSAHSGNSCWDINLNGPHGNSAVSGLITPEFNLSGNNVIRISFWMNFNVEQFWDGFLLQYTTDSVSNTWENIDTLNGQYFSNWNNGNLVAYNGYLGWTGNSNGWKYASITMPAPTPSDQVWFRFLFVSDNIVILDGVSIDDFTIEPEIMNVFSGSVYLDVNSNSIIDAPDTGMPGVLFTGIPGSSSNYQVSQSDGSWYFLADSGVATTVTPTPPLYGTILPGSATTTFSGTNQVNSGNNFLVTYTPGITDPGVQVFTTPVRPDLTHIKTIHFYNQGTSPVSGTIEFTYDPSFTLNSASESYNTLAPHSIEFTYSFLLPGESRNISIEFYADSMLLAGTATLVSAVINPVAGDPDSTNNYITLETLVVNSCDPNNKLAFPEGDLTVGQVSAGIDINYTINFQNTGTAEAINITILDPIDINLDLSTLYITGSSHPISSYSILPNRTLRFIFENINLPDSTSNEPGSHGFVGFQISPYQNLSAGTVLSNTAYNYFDNNLPIPTNTIVHTVDIAIGLEEDDDNLVLLIYPNPASQVITVHVPEGYEMWEILNIYGQTVRKGIVELYRINFEADISELSAGIYQVRITGNNNHPLTTPLLIAR